MQPYILINSTDGEKVEYTAYIPGRAEVNAVAKVGQIIDLDNGLPRIEEEEYEPETD